MYIYNHYQMILLKRSDSSNTDFQALVRELDEDLALRDGEEHSFFAQFNKIDAIRHVVLAYSNNSPVGCGAVKPYNTGTMEVKRMFVVPASRGLGIASLVLEELERWSRELGFDTCILETGEKQPEAIRLYQKNNYKVIPNFGQYANVAGSVCFEKQL